jgi:DNA-binding MarR family transcriptional regulator
MTTPLREVLRELEMHGVKPEVSSDGPHHKVQWHAGAHNRLVVVSKTASDYRAALNARAVTRRYLRADKVQPLSRVQLAMTAPLVEADADPGDRIDKLERDVQELKDLIVELISNSVAAEKPAKTIIKTVEEEPPRISRAQRQILLWLDYVTPRTVGDLAKRLRMNYHSVAAHLSVLKQRGLVRNMPNRSGWLKVIVQTNNAQE